MGSKKKAQKPEVKVSVDRKIRLKPSTTDYATFVKTTAEALGKPELALTKSKPNMRMLSLVNLGS